MRMRYATLDDLTVRTLEGFGRRLGRGACVDFDDVVDVVPADHAGHLRHVTLEEALGEYAGTFTDHQPVEEPAEPSPAPETRRRRRPQDAQE